MSRDHEAELRQRKENTDICDLFVTDATVKAISW